MNACVTVIALLCSRMFKLSFIVARPVTHFLLLQNLYLFHFTPNYLQVILEQGCLQKCSQVCAKALQLNGQGWAIPAIEIANNISSIV